MKASCSWGETNEYSIPIITLKGINESEATRKEVIKKINDASQSWGFFQLVNHGIPSNILEDMIDGVKRFHEQDPEIRKEYYSGESERAMFYTNLHLFKALAGHSRDTFLSQMYPNPPQKLPDVCRDILLEYSKEMRKLGLVLLELMSEALRLDRNHLRDMECAKELLVSGYYYPKAPEPDPTMGLVKHTDSTFLTMLLQDHIGGLQVLHQDQWLDVTPIPLSLIVNIGDMMQLITNGKFNSVYHRVLAQKKGPRISVASALRNVGEGNSGSPISYAPIKELLSGQNPPLYKETTFLDYVSRKHSKGVGGVLDHLKL